MTGGVFVSDTGPIIALAQIDLLDVVPHLFGRIVIPPAVRRELITVAPPSWLEETGWQRRIDPRVAAATLDPGESEVLTLALDIGADGVLIDDLPARLLAERMGLVVIGTLGVLVRAHDGGMVTGIRPYLDDLRSHNFFMTEHLYRRLLSAVGESD